MYKTIEELVTKVDERNSDGTISERLLLHIVRRMLSKVFMIIRKNL